MYLLGVCVPRYFHRSWCSTSILLMQGLSSFRYCIFRVSCQSSQANSISISHLSVSAGLYVHTTSGFLRRFLAGWQLLLFTSRDISPKSSQHRTLCNSPSSCLSLSNAGITGVCQHFCLDVFCCYCFLSLHRPLCSPGWLQTQEITRLCLPE